MIYQCETFQVALHFHCPILPPSFTRYDRQRLPLPLHALHITFSHSYLSSVPPTPVPNAKLSAYKPPRLDFKLSSSSPKTRVRHGHPRIPRRLGGKKNKFRIPGSSLIGSYTPSPEFFEAPNRHGELMLPSLEMSPTQMGSIR